MRCTFLYLFTCYLHNLMQLVEYVEKNQKEIKGSPKHPLINFTYLFILLFFSYQFWGFTGAYNPSGVGHCGWPVETFLEGVSNEGSRCCMVTTSPRVYFL
jgi:hypothetical protein